MLTLISFNRFSKTVYVPDTFEGWAGREMQSHITFLGVSRHSELLHTT